MSDTVSEVKPVKFHGGTAPYTTIASRGDGEYLGVGIQYGIHPTGVGVFVVRFVGYGKDVTPEGFGHFSGRAIGSYSTAEGKHFTGVRLNKLAIPAFKPAVRYEDVRETVEQFGTFDTLAAWIVEQVKAEGFVLSVSDIAIADILREEFPVKPPKVETESILAESLPKLDAPEEKATKSSNLHLVPLKNYDEGDEQDDADDDADDDESDDDDEPWLN